MAGTSIAELDAVVVGAGTAGAAAAYQLATRGMSVALLDRRPLDEAGAQWHNGVLDWQFERAGLAPPAPPERVADAVRTHMFGPDGTPACTLDASPTVAAHMGLLGRRLRGLAAGAGTETYDHVEQISVVPRGDRISAIDVSMGGPGGKRAIRLVAPLFVDASGRRGILRNESKVLEPWCPQVRGDELCSAADFHMRVADRDGARRFLERHGALPGEGVSVLGRHGGFSAQSMTVSEDLEQVGVLVGCLANGRYGTGPRLLADLRVEEPWIGEPIHGGFGVIPLRRPYARFTAPGLALVGDAACQVFPAHGSGIGMGLIAGRLLAEAVAGEVDPGDGEVLWGYQLAFQREFGGLMAFYDSVRRLSTALGTDGVAQLTRAGLTGETTTLAALNQTWATPPLAEMPRLAVNLFRSPKLASKVLPRLARGQLLARVGSTHPESPDAAALARWDRRVERLLGSLPS